jgi:hypothetical protein
MKKMFFVVAVLAVVLFQNHHSKNVEAERLKALDVRCSAQAAKPYVPFKSDLGCTRWNPVKSDIPLPLEG